MAVTALVIVRALVVLALTLVVSMMTIPTGDKATWKIIYRLAGLIFDITA